MTGLVADVEGTRRIREVAEGPPESAEALGIALAETLLSRGAQEILDEVYSIG